VNTERQRALIAAEDREAERRREEWRREMAERELRLELMFRHINYTTTDTKLEFLIDGFLPRRYVTILAGDPKIGKTALASAIALAIAEGSPFAGMQSQKAGVLWLSLEETREERATIMAPAKERLGETDFFISYFANKIDDEQSLLDLRTWVNDIDAGLIVVDPLHAAHSGRSLNDGWNARRTLAPLKRFCDNNNIAALVLHHIGRSNRRVAESSQLAAVAGISWLLTMRQEQDRRVVKLRGAGRGEFANRVWHFASDSPLHYQPITHSEALPEKERQAPMPPKTKLVDEVYDWLAANEGRHACSDIAAHLERNPNSVRNAIARLLVAKRIQWMGGQANTNFYAAIKNESFDETNTEEK
jgi:hypothetical protein